MSEIEVINERLNRGEEKFSEVALALDGIKIHLQSQDAAMSSLSAKIDKTVTGTESIVEMWNGGVTAVRFFCRLAEAWKFMLKQVFGPIGIPVMLLYGFWYYTEFHKFPDWLNAAFKLFMAVI